MSVEDRLMDLEVRLAYQGKLLASLDEVVREFTVRVERLERRLAEVDASGPDPESPPEEPPPHY